MGMESLNTPAEESTGLGLLQDTAHLNCTADPWPHEYAVWSDAAPVTTSMCCQCTSGHPVRGSTVAHHPSTDGMEGSLVVNAVSQVRSGHGRPFSIATTAGDTRSWVKLVQLFKPSHNAAKVEVMSTVQGTPFTPMSVLEKKAYVVEMILFAGQLTENRDKSVTVLVTLDTVVYAPTPLPAVPAGHDTHPVDEATVFIGHARHDVEPTTGATVPGAHTVQFVALEAVENIPIGQGRQADTPVTLEKNPGLHPAQAYAPPCGGYGRLTV